MKLLKKYLSAVIYRQGLGRLTASANFAPIAAAIALFAASSLQAAVEPTVQLEEAFSRSSANPLWVAGIGSVNEGVGSDLPCLTAAPLDPSNPPIGNFPPFPRTQPLKGCPLTSVRDPEGEGVLRLTSNKNNQAGFVLYNDSFPSANGLVITFDLYVYGGNGADGISFFLIDGNTSPLQAGAFGGSLGYAQKSTAAGGEVDAPGLEGGYVGIGFDEFGNYSNPTEGRVDGQGSIPDAVALRGSQATNYRYLTGTGSLPQGLDFPDVNGRSQAIKRTARITLTPDNKISVDIDFGSGFVSIIPEYDLTAVQGRIPDSFRFGFAAATGAKVNFHEIRTFVVRPVPPDLSIDKIPAGNFTIGSQGTYTLKVQNSPSAGSTTDTITVTDTLPAGLNFVSGTGTNWNCSAVGQDVTCTYTGSAAPGESLPDIAINVNVTPAAAANLSNTATVATTGDSNPKNNTKTASTTVNPPLPVVSSKTSTLSDANGNGIGDPGEVITYAIAITNNGSTRLTNTVFTDKIPANTTYVPNTTLFNDVAQADVADNMPFVNGAPVNSPGEPSGEINPNETATVSFKVKINQFLPSNVTQISNQGLVKSNEITQTLLTDDPVTSSPADPTITPTIPSVPEPGIGEPALRLIKRITAIRRGGILTSFNSVVDDPIDVNDTAPGFAQLPPVGVPKLEPTTPLYSGDQVEYTIYYLSNGTAAANNVKFCDPIPTGTSLVPNTIEARLGTSAVGGTFFSPLAPLPVGNACPNQTNPDGAVIVDVGDISQNPGSNFGFIRFSVKVD